MVQEWIFQTLWTGCCQVFVHYFWSHCLGKKFMTFLLWPWFKVITTLVQGHKLLSFLSNARHGLPMSPFLTVSLTLDEMTLLHYLVIKILPANYTVKFRFHQSFTHRFFKMFIPVTLALRKRHRYRIRKWMPDYEQLYAKCQLVMCTHYSVGE